MYDWESTRAVAWAEAGVGAVLLGLAVFGRCRQAPESRLRFWGPWAVALGLILAVWELASAKLGWRPRPFFTPPQGIVDVYVDDRERLGTCVLHSLRLWGTGYFVGVTPGVLAGTAIGWSSRVAYWLQPLLKVIGPVPANAWLPIVFFAFPTTFSGSVFLIALA